jgi:hypothetical protein
VLPQYRSRFPDNNQNSTVVEIVKGVAERQDFVIQDVLKDLADAKVSHGLDKKHEDKRDGKGLV